MKKTLAVILSVVMLVCCIPFSVNAADSQSVVWNENKIISETYILESHHNYTLQSGYTLTVNSGTSLYIPKDCTVTIMDKATLFCNGSIYVEGSLIIDGIINGGNSSQIYVLTGGSAKAAVRFPDLKSLGLEKRITVSYGVTESGNAYEDQQEDFEWNPLETIGGTVYCPINQTVHVKAEILEDEPPFDKYDDSKMTVFVNGIAAPYGQGSVNFAVTSSVNISYRAWDKDDNFLNTFKIHLPTGEGYAVYGREGEQSALGETVTLKYGQSFAFKVELEPEYDMSAYEVYIYDGYGWISLDPSQDLSGLEPAKPDDYGYYLIDSVKGDCQVYVTGVAKNETILMVGSILDMVKNIFDMISGFFQEILAFLGISFGGEAA